MYIYGLSSRQRLSTVRGDLSSVAKRALGYQVMDITILCGHRNMVKQNKAFEDGMSKVMWPDSEHNTLPSKALDFAPWILLPSGIWGIDWSDTHAFAIVGGLFLAAGAELGVKLRYGSDWDGDGSTKDQDLMDYGHIEVVTDD